ncbi:MAG TPA: class I SAM-dependent methyltransferase [Thermoanaerobaculia bacterium]
MTTANDRIRQRLYAPDPALLAKIRAEVWNGHNVALTTSESTIPGVTLIENDERTRVIKSCIRRFVQKPNMRVLDLGSNEGGLSLEMAREGWEVLGVEGREQNFRKAELIRDYFALPNLRFQQRDVKELSPERDGTFDAILCCGLLYHLDNPFAHLEQMITLLAPDGLFFLDTHVAPDAVSMRYGTHERHLSDEVTVEHRGHSYTGRWFAEPQETRLDEEWRAVSNDRSFWPDRRSLIRALYHTGYRSLHELFGIFEIDRELGLKDQFSRLYLACAKTW